MLGAFQPKSRKSFGKALEHADEPQSRREEEADPERHDGGDAHQGPWHERRGRPVEQDGEANNREGDLRSDLDRHINHQRSRGRAGLDAAKLHRPNAEHLAGAGHQREEIAARIPNPAKEDEGQDACARLGKECAPGKSAKHKRHEMIRDDGKKPLPSRQFERSADRGEPVPSDERDDRAEAE